jgi:hypothetical protein
MFSEYIVALIAIEIETKVKAERLRTILYLRLGLQPWLLIKEIRLGLGWC